jgi:hypothetical protein
VAAAAPDDRPLAAQTALQKQLEARAAPMEMEPLAPALPQ